MPEDKSLKCVECGEQFNFSVRDQQFFEKQGFQPPKRCKPCRDFKKQQYGRRQSS